MAWALAQKRLPGRRAILLIVLVTIVFDPGIIPEFFVMKNIGLLNQLLVGHPLSRSLRLVPHHFDPLV